MTAQFIVTDLARWLLFEVIEVINSIFDFTVPSRQKQRLWRPQSLGITAAYGEDRESPGLCMPLPTYHGGGVSVGKAGVGGKFVTLVALRTKVLNWAVSCIATAPFSDIH